MVITDKDVIEVDGYAIHLPPKVEGQTHWQIQYVDTTRLSPAKEWRVILEDERDGQPTASREAGAPTLTVE